MVKIYSLKNLSFVLASLSLLVLASCKKDHHTTTATPTKLGLYAYSSSIYKELGIVISQIGTQPLDSLLVFDTGSGGMVIDATNILPASMISSSGFVFTGDSTVVDGITLTNQKDSIEYGDDAATTNKVYGNLAYASVTIGDENGNIVIKRLPFFLYYKAVDAQNNILTAHEFDVFGVSPEYDVQFSNNAYITSPFSYFDPGTGLTKGFKMSVIGTSDYSYLGTYVDALTLGLTSDDLLGSSGFNFSTLSFYQGDGYAPIIPGTVTYNTGGNTNKSFASYVLFDTGTEPYSYLEDPTYNGKSTDLLPTNSSVSVSTTSGFNYSYNTSATENLTNVENPGSPNNVTIFGLEFFLNNEYMIDFTDHKLGLKNN